MDQLQTRGLPTCCPCLFYDDVDAAVRFLADAFGLEERFANRGADGRRVHSQVGRDGGVVMLGFARSPDAVRPTSTPSRLGSLHSSVYLFVPDVDVHCAHARRHGAEVVLEPADMPWGDRLYCAVDPEGQFWAFATPLSPARASESGH